MAVYIYYIKEDGGIGGVSDKGRKGMIICKALT